MRFLFLRLVWPVSSGTKSFVITTATHIGGKNPFLGLAYVMIGMLGGVLGLVLTVKHFLQTPWGDRCGSLMSSHNVTDFSVMFVSPLSLRAISLQLLILGR